MIEQIWNLIGNDLLSILSTLVSTFTIYMIAKIKRLYEEKANNDIKRSIVKTVVNAVEQVYKDLSGDDKLIRAQENIKSLLKEKRISMTELEMNLMIEEICHSFK